MPSFPVVPPHAGVGTIEVAIRRFAWSLPLFHFYAHLRFQFSYSSETTASSHAAKANTALVLYFVFMQRLGCAISSHLPTHLNRIDKGDDYVSSTTERIVLGSGELFYMEHTGDLPTTEEICVPENRLGHVSGGATLEYTPSYCQ